MISPVGSHSSVTFTSASECLFSSTRAAVRFTNSAEARRRLAIETRPRANSFEIFQLEAKYRNTQFASIATTRVGTLTLLVVSTGENSSQRFWCERSVRVLLEDAGESDTF